jgi:thiosulfate dehydrogenase
MKRVALLGLSGGMSLLLLGALWAGAQEKQRSPFLLPPDQVMAMKKMMMEMQPDTLEAGIERGKKLFNDKTLGDNTTGKSCATCHKDGGTIGGASEMEWKGMKMKVNIPTLIGAAAHFPKPMGPMKALIDLAGMNNMCIMTFLKGDPLDKNSQEAVDLVAYVTSLSKGKKLEPGADKIVPRPEPGAM